MPAPPTGTVTLLFTDIEGSTQLLQHLGERYAAVLAAHQQILREAFQHRNGCEVRTEGDSFFLAFARAGDALAAAVSAQQALATHPWPEGAAVRVRMGLHTGEPACVGEDYVGLDVHRAARLSAAGHGGQVLVSRTTRDLVEHDLPEGVSLRDLGQHRLKDLLRPEHLFQLVIADLPHTFPPLKTLDAHLTNLPLQATALIGRENEIVTLCGLLHRTDVRLVTLTGPGGAGKTRLGLQVAAELLADVADGTWFVNLAPISDPSLVAAAVAQTLGIKESAGRSLLDNLKHYLREKQLLLLLDNFEQIIAAVPLVSELLASAPGLKVLATSRMPLHLSGEREFAVAPLALPPLEPRTKNQEPARAGQDTVLGPRFSVLSSVMDLTQYAAVQLFIERAQAVKADFAVTNANAPAIAEICYQLDGLPLAIELAAARIKLFPPQALLMRLSRRLTLLTAGARDLPARQQTIRNTIDWSYQLLDADEQRLFARLGVFVGGCTLEAAEAICPAEGDLGADVLDGLQSLVDQSLVRQNEGLDGEPRFTLLETIREYALERLAASGEVELLRQRHADYYLKLVETAEPNLRGAEQLAWLDRLEREHDNLHAALVWSQTANEVEVVARLAGAMGWFWRMQGYPTGGLGWLELALEHAKVLPAALRAKVLLRAGDLVRPSDNRRSEALLTEGLALYQAVGNERGAAETLSGLGDVAFNRGEYDRATVFYKESLTLYRAIGDKWGIAVELRSLGRVARDQGAYAAAVTLLEESLMLRRELGDQLGAARVLNDLGGALQRHGDYQRATTILNESLALSQELGDQNGSTWSLWSLADMARSQGNYTEAAHWYQESLRLFREMGHKAGIASCLMGLAGVAEAQGQVQRAAKLFGAMEALLAAINMSLDPAECADFNKSMATIRVQLDEVTLATTWARGQTLTLEQAIAYALEPLSELAPPTAPLLARQPTTPTGPSPAGLTRREVEVLRLIAQGLTDAQVAERLVLSAHTVHAHLRSIYGKLNVTSRAAATRFAVEHHLV